MSSMRFAHADSNGAVASLPKGYRPALNATYVNPARRGIEDVDMRRPT